MYCGLPQPDISIQPAGDQTEIGEKVCTVGSLNLTSVYYLQGTRQR